MVEWNEQDLYDKIFETRSRKSQFVKRINALCITQYYDERQSQYEGITISVIALYTYVYTYK